MLSDYTGGPASPLGMVVKLGMMTCEIIYHKAILIDYEWKKPARLKARAEARKLPDKRLHISGDRYVH